MDAKYIMIDIDYQEELKINTDIFKQNMIELSESSSNYGDIATDLDTNDSDTVSLKSDDKNIGLVEKKKRGRKKKEKSYRKYRKNQKTIKIKKPTNRWVNFFTESYII